MLFLKLNNFKLGIQKLLIKQKSLIRRSSYILFHVTQQLYNLINLITNMDLCEFENLKKVNFILYELIFLLNPVNFICMRIYKFTSIYNMVYFIIFVCIY